MLSVSLEEETSPGVVLDSVLASRSAVHSVSREGDPG